MQREQRTPTAGQPAVLRILHLEDDELDRELVCRALRTDAFTGEFVYASSREEFVAAIQREHFDLILSDFTIPGYDGAAALAFARQHCPDVPYLFISGTIGEQRAIDSLKNGATDYVLKDNLERLLPAVLRALREAEERVKRKAAEDAMREAEARFRSIFENAIEGIYQSTPDGRLLDVNRAMARLCGYESPQELQAGIRDWARDIYVNAKDHAEFARRLNEQGEVLACESQIRRRDGSTIWISENARAVRDAAGQVIYYEGMVTDITARRTAEEALRQSEERFRAMAETIDNVFWISTLGGRRLLYVSPAYEQIWGRPVSELYENPKQWLDAIVPEDRVLVLEAREQLTRGKEYRIEYRINRPDGTQRWIEDRSYPTRDPASETKRAVGVAMDITRRKQLESQLLQSQKMDAVGQLAGGVAHDFNNVLTVVNGYARLLLDGGTMPPDSIEPLTQIYTAGTRAANLTRQLLVFSRKQAVHRQIIDLNEVVDEIGKMLRRLIGEHIGLQVALAPQPCLIEADAVMMEQVLMNLAVNARDAMLNGGTMTISTELTKIDQLSGRHHPEARTGEFVSLSVRDTGCGIAPENLARIFEPFFTTKEIGHGTGLGLATVFGIVQQHQGWIDVESTVGAGTRFLVMLPMAQEQVALPARRSAKAQTAHGGTETVLLVEDETTVREFGVAVLRSHGYRVLQASSGVEALEVWKWHGSRIALLFSDLVLPDGVGGVELAAMLRKEKPTLPVVLTSGYANATIEEGFTPPAGTHFIHKPYKPQVLAQTVRDALDGSFNR